MYKLVLCHFNNFVINGAFFQRLAYVLNTRQHLNFLRLPIDISNRLFNSLYLPILMYGSEVWSIYDKDDYNLWENDVIEKTQIQFCKQVLGVNKQCPNVACRNELGRLPLKEITNVNIIKFWIHLENKQDQKMIIMDR